MFLSILCQFYAIHDSNDHCQRICQMRATNLILYGGLSPYSYVIDEDLTFPLPNALVKCSLGCCKLTLDGI